MLYQPPADNLSPAKVQGLNFARLTTFPDSSEIVSIEILNSIAKAHPLE